MPGVMLSMTILINRKDWEQQKVRVGKQIMVKWSWWKDKLIYLPDSVVSKPASLLLFWIFHKPPHVLLLGYLGSFIIHNFLRKESMFFWKIKHRVECMYLKNVLIHATVKEFLLWQVFAKLDALICWTNQWNVHVE